MTALDLNELARKYEIAMHDDGMAVNTVKTNMDTVRALLKWQAANDRHGLGLDEVRGFIGSILGGESKGARNTARTRARGIRAFAAWALRDGHIASNELTALNVPREAQQHMRILTDEELSRFQAACRAAGGFLGCRDEALLNLYAYTGARASEALKLYVHQDLDMTPGREAVIFRGPKGNRDRKVPLVGAARDSMTRYLAARREEGYGTTGPLWLSTRRAGLQYDGASTILDRRAQDAGIGDFHLHMLRNWFAVTWLLRGGSESGLRQLAGWMSNDMLQHYISAAAELLADAEARRLFG